MSIKVLYRPRGSTPPIPSLVIADASPELLRAQGIITGPYVGDQGGQGSGINSNKRPREDGPSATPGPSKRPTVKREENDTRTQRIRALQVSRS